MGVRVPPSALSRFPGQGAFRTICHSLGAELSRLKPTSRWLGRRARWQEASERFRGGPVHGSCAVYLGRDAEDRVRHRHVTFKGSRRQAERELARLVATQDAEPALIPEAPAAWGPATTINDAIAAWRDNGWDDLSPKTARHYESIWRVHIAQTIGRRRVASLGPYDVERHYRTLKAEGLSMATVRQVKAVLRRSCRLAHKWSGGVLPNPAADADEMKERLTAPV